MDGSHGDGYTLKKMAVPTITSVTPNVGHTSPGTLVEVIGTGFRLPTQGEEPVAVYFGAERSPRVDVITVTRLFAIAPLNDLGAVDLRVANIDENGVEIPGEDVTATGAYTYKLPNLGTDQESEISAVVRALLTELKRQIVKSVAISTHPDYQVPESTEIHAVTLPSLPGLVLVGPNLSENRFYSLNEEPECDDESTSDPDGPVEFDKTQVPATYDLGFSLLGFADRKLIIQNLMQSVVYFFKRNKFLQVTIGSKVLEYEMDVEAGGDPQMVGTANNSGLHAFTSQLVIRGVDLNGLTGFGDPLFSERNFRGSYTDDQGAELQATQQLSPDPPLVVRSILSQGC